MKRQHIYKGTKRSIVFNVLTGRYTVGQAARYVRVQPATVRRWLNKFGQEFLTTPVTNE
jgi:transposase-like protein